MTWRARATALVVVAASQLSGSVAHADDTPPAIRTTDQFVPTTPEPDGSPVRLDTRIYAPTSSGPHPAVLLAHGFGGSKADLEQQAQTLAREGHVVLTYSARGFGSSGGRIHLDAPEFEVADAKRLVDVLAARADVRQDKTNDPRVAVAGGSYGGALALMLAGVDPRIDAVVASITWNDLAGALFPQSADGTTGPGPFKQLWASQFYGAALRGAQTGGSGGSDPLCGRFDPTVCRLLRDAAETGTPSADLLTLLRRNSPDPTLARITAPTLLVQGMNDTLFGLDQADANARALASAGTTVAVRWMDGGHDGPSTTAALDEEAMTTWIERYLTSGRDAARPVPAFAYALPLTRGADSARIVTAETYPGLHNAPATVPMIRREPAVVLNPPGGQPSSLTTVPGLSSLAATLPTYALAALPGSSTAFDSDPVARDVTAVGSPTVRLSVTSTGAASTLFVSLWQVQGSTATRPRSLVAPLRVTVTPGKAREVTVNLPAATYRLAAGSRWRVLVTTTDNAYAGPRDARGDRVQIVSALSLPTVAGSVTATATDRDLESVLLIAAIAALLTLLGAAALLRRRRRAREHVRDDLADVPLVVDSLVKTYADGHRAVDDVSWRAEKGQVVGLLGPNGAGKTTTMRMLLGLITPDSGTVHVLGRPVHAGSPILAKVGALVEGPGFLPHLTGRENLRAYWRATGRPESEAAYDEAMSVAALGGALDRPVRTYSQGMRQRLGIAQAMLGRPDVLFLDEPTNGLDPPQIAAMRPILQSYAATGRTVVVSSHLLAEVEQTCSHVVVMHAGRVVTAGPVADLVSSEDTTVLEVDAGADLAAAASSLSATPGVRSVETLDESGRRTLTIVADVPRADIVRAAVEAGIPVTGVGSRRQLEEVFLGVIASARTEDDDGTTSMVDRLRQVRAR